MTKITIENKSAVTLHGLKPGATKRIEVDRDGIALDRNWRRRIADSKIDGAIVQVETKSAKPKKETKKKEMED